MEVFKQFRDTKYRVSDKGKVVGATGKELKPFLRNGYVRASLYMEKKKINFSVHRMVYETFVGTIPEGMDVNHKNFKKRHNYVSNLELVSRRENVTYRKNKRESVKYTGVYFHKPSGKFRAKLYVNKKYKYLGDFNSAEDARDAYQNVN